MAETSTDIPISTLLTVEPISANSLSQEVASHVSGAVVTFSGNVRDHDHGRRVERLHYECYASMADRVIASIVIEIKARWPVQDALVLHRVGTLSIGDIAVAIAVTSAHREEAFAACRFAIESVKSRAPIWKKEYFKDGTSEWVFCAHPSVVTA